VSLRDRGVRQRIADRELARVASHPVLEARRLQLEIATEIRAELLASGHSPYTEPGPWGTPRNGSSPDRSQSFCRAPGAPHRHPARAEGRRSRPTSRSAPPVRAPRQTRRHVPPKRRVPSLNRSAPEQRRRRVEPKLGRGFTVPPLVPSKRHEARPRSIVVGSRQHEQTTHRLFEQAQADVSTRRTRRASGSHEWSCFAAQQGPEKAVKALYYRAAVSRGACNNQAPSESSLRLSMFPGRNCGSAASRPTLHPDALSQRLRCPESRRLFVDEDSQVAISDAEIILDWVEPQVR